MKTTTVTRSSDRRSPPAAGGWSRRAAASGVAVAVLAVTAPALPAWAQDRAVLACDAASCICCHFPDDSGALCLGSAERQACVEAGGSTVELGRCSGPCQVKVSDLGLPEQVIGGSYAGPGARGTGGGSAAAGAGTAATVPQEPDPPEETPPEETPLEEANRHFDNVVEDRSEGMKAFARGDADAARLHSDRAVSEAKAMAARAASVSVGKGKLRGEFSLATAVTGGVANDGFEYPFAALANLRFIFWINREATIGVEVAARASTTVSVKFGSEDEEEGSGYVAENASEDDSGGYFGWNAVGILRGWIYYVAPVFFAGYNQQVIDEERAGISIGPGLSLGTRPRKDRYFVFTGKVDFGAQQSVDLVADIGVNMAYFSFVAKIYTKSHTNLSFIGLANVGLRFPW